MMKHIATAVIIAAAFLVAPAAGGEDPPVASKRTTIRFGQLPRFAAGTRGMSFSPDSRLLAAGRTIEGLAIWDVATGKQVPLPKPKEENQDEGGLPIVGMMAGGSSSDTAAVFLPDNKTIVFADMMFGLGLLDMETGKSKKIGPPPAQGKPAKNKGARAIPNVPPELEGLIPDLNNMGGVNHALQSSPDGKYMAVSNMVDVSILDISTGQSRAFATHGKRERRAMPGGGVSTMTQNLPGMTPPNQLGFTADDKLLVVGEYDGNFRVFDVKTGKLKRTLGNRGKASFGYSALARDGSRVAIADAVGKQGIRVLDVETGKEVQAIKFSGAIMSAAAIDLSADGQMLAFITGTVTGTNPPVIVDVKSGKILATLGEMPKQPEKKSRKPKPKPGQPAVQANQEMPVGAVAFSPDGKTIATSTILGGDIDLWDNPLTAATPVTPDQDANAKK